MRIIDAITPLLVESRLFEDPVKLSQPPQAKKKKNYTHMGLKIGQGGTLDPLADGVLGMPPLQLPVHVIELTSSYWRQQRN